MMLKEYLEKRGEFKENFPLSRISSIKIGGVCIGLWIPDGLESLLEGLGFLVEKGLDFKVISGGTNVLINDRKLDFIVISLRKFKKISLEDGLLKAGAGLKFSHLLKYCRENSLSGLEFLAGVPARLAGGLANNFSFKNTSFSDVVEQVSVIDVSILAVKNIQRSDIYFSHHYSSLKEQNYIITEVWLKTAKKSFKSIIRKIKENIQYRLAFQDLKYPSLGCIFKNPSSSVSAGRLIDECGLKGFGIGGAGVSFKHANFIINKGRAGFEDVISLISYVKEKVYQKTGVRLEEEIEIWQ
ncbi:MAG: UDP-N-acetylenolpyruvoylglucosamine reductase [Thermoprotei archaeon]|nr:MAG: UDP-N-acetylenolpyruvoylglucosamine reductase [Thermoprotei archaeon]